MIPPLHLVWRNLSSAAPAMVAGTWPSSSCMPNEHYFLCLFNDLVQLLRATSIHWFYVDNIVNGFSNVVPGKDYGSIQKIAEDITSTAGLLGGIVLFGAGFSTFVVLTLEPWKRWHDNIACLVNLHLKSTTAPLSKQAKYYLLPCK